MHLSAPAARSSKNLISHVMNNFVFIVMLVHKAHYFADKTHFSPSPAFNWLFPFRKVTLSSEFAALSLELTALSLELIIFTPPQGALRPHIIFIQSIANAYHIYDIDMISLRHLCATYAPSFFLAHRFINIF